MPPSDRAAPDEVVALQHVTDGGPGGPGPTGAATVQDGQEFLGTPGGMPSARLEEGVDDVRGGIGRVMGPAVSIVQPAHAVDFVPRNPFVGRGPTDLEPSTEFSDRGRPRGDSRR
jgi:hypothetical protein